jgi:hypothetical protein
MLKSFTARLKRQKGEKLEKKSDFNISSPCSSNNAFSNADNQCLTFKFNT